MDAQDTPKPSGGLLGRNLRGSAGAGALQRLLPWLIASMLIACSSSSVVDDDIEFDPNEEGGGPGGDGPGGDDPEDDPDNPDAIAPRVVWLIDGSLSQGIERSDEAIASKGHEKSRLAPFVSALVGLNRSESVDEEGAIEADCTAADQSPRVAEQLQAAGIESTVMIAPAAQDVCGSVFAEDLVLNTDTEGLGDFSSRLCAFSPRGRTPVDRVLEEAGAFMTEYGPQTEAAKTVRVFVTDGDAYTCVQDDDGQWLSSLVQLEDPEELAPAVRASCEAGYPTFVVSTRIDEDLPAADTATEMMSMVAREGANAVSMPDNEVVTYTSATLTELAARIQGILTGEQANPCSTTQ